MSETKLLPCPFCGGVAETDLCSGWWAVRCTACNTRLPGLSTEDDSRASWNRRAPPADARLREAQRAGLDAALLDAWHDAAIEECAQIVEHVASNLPLGFGTASGGVVAQEAAKRIRALRSAPSPAPLSPSKGARETPALDGVLDALADSDTFYEDQIATARAELSALKAAAASPTVKMPERKIGWKDRRGGRTLSLDDQGWNACLAEFQRLNPPASPQDGKAKKCPCCGDEPHDCPHNSGCCERCP